MTSDLFNSVWPQWISGGGGSMTLTGSKVLHTHRLPHQRRFEGRKEVQCPLVRRTSTILCLWSLLLQLWCNPKWWTGLTSANQLSLPSKAASMLAETGGPVHVDYKWTVDSYWSVLIYVTIYTLDWAECFYTGWDSSLRPRCVNFPSEKYLISANIEL